LRSQSDSWRKCLKGEMSREKTDMEERGKRYERSVVNSRRKFNVIQYSLTHGKIEDEKVIDYRKK
jgi:hypothetical protein